MTTDQWYAKLRRRPPAELISRKRQLECEDLESHRNEIEAIKRILDECRIWVGTY